MVIQRTRSGYVVPVLVQPGASANRIYGEHMGRLKVSVSTPPHKGKANRALREFLAARLGLNASQIRILRGHNSRRKEVLIERVDRDALEAIIA